MKKMFLLVVGLIVISSSVYAAGDLIVSGNVGIGTISPGAILDVKGGVDGTNMFLRNSTGQTANYLSFYEITGNQWNVGNYGTSKFAIFQNGTAPGSSGIIFTGGNVGIGTTNPVGKLDVNGSIYQRGSQLHADYVFDPKYALESIEDHSKFMWENKHLKAIPKASIDENGMEIVEVGARNKGMVEELEKAHIYIVELNKRIKTLEEKLASLENNNKK